MNKVAFVKSIDGGKFAVLVESDGGVDAIGISAHGKEWSAWVDVLPFRERRKIEDVLWSISEAQVVDGPRVPTRVERADITALLNGEQTANITNG
jgi:hypothetical protein